jgi:hypothetical protein
MFKKLWLPLLFFALSLITFHLGVYYQKRVEVKSSGEISATLTSYEDQRAAHHSLFTRICDSEIVNLLYVSTEQASLECNEDGGWTIIYFGGQVIGIETKSENN